MLASLALLFFFIHLQGMAQSDFIVFLQDASGQHLSGASVTLIQDGQALKVEENAVGGYYVAKIDPQKAAYIDAKKRGYKIGQREIQPPYDILFATLSAGKRGDSMITILGVPTYYIPHPELIALYPRATVWQQAAQLAELEAWEKAHGLVRTEAPWPQKDEILQRRVERPLLYRKSDGSAFPPDDVAALAAIRGFDWVISAGVPLWPGIVLGNRFVANNCTAPADWVAKHALTVEPPTVRGMPWKIAGSPGLGAGAADLLHILAESGYFDGVCPEMYHPVSLD